MENGESSSKSGKSVFVQPKSHPKQDQTCAVFLSFSGEETLSSFTSHLYAALQKAKITVFTNDNEVKRGGHISKSLSSAIEESKFFIIIFSKNYASSRRCLDELEKIVNCGRTIGNVVPVFYHVDPYEVRRQTGEFGVAFQSLLNKTSNDEELVQSWRAALSRAASIPGFVILNSRHEIEDIKHIVDGVSDLLNYESQVFSSVTSMFDGFFNGLYPSMPTRERFRQFHSKSDPDPDSQSGLISEPIRIHDVFLSFRGEDTRSCFVSHLYAALRNAGIKVFKDDNELERGDHISTALLRAIEKSTISLIVFSNNYANSRWCLDELRKIMKCSRTIGQVVVPVFYHVDPSDVRHQTGQFGISFQSLMNKISNMVELVQSWREALRQAASIAGFVIPNSRNENEDIKGIVNSISHLLNKTDLFISNNPVGIESRVQDVIQLLDFRSIGVQLVGMWGMGGIGKTTITKAIYNKIGRNFDGRSFLANIREDGAKIAGQVRLQEQLLFDICKGRTIKIPNTELGKNILKDKLCHKRVLIVLDDVNTLDQLNTFCGSREWFGSGSVIIITTRDLDLLSGRVDKIYKMTTMNESESIELFSWNAFKEASPTRDFIRVAGNVVEYCGGLPLALEVLGSYLFEKAKSKWDLVLEKLKRIPNDQVQKKLRISYDDLNDDDEQEIFLDIACFLIGMDRNDVILVLNDCGLSAEIGISVLVERSLVSVDDKNMLEMHGLLRDMGREIVRAESPWNPEKRRRFWVPKDVLGVLSNQTGKSVIGLALKLPKANAKCLSTKAFEKMKRLRLLQLAEVKLDGDFEYVSRDLRLLSWNGLSHIPTNFHGENLVSIVLENSNVELLWNTSVRMRMLKILNLSHSHYLTQSPDFSNMPNLEKLVLKDCPKISEVSPSIGNLNKILLINLEDCISLCSLPRSIYKLKSLKTFILSGCLKIDKLEEELERMESLTTLLAKNTAITRVPFSVVRSKSIGYISLCGYEGFSSDVFPLIILSSMSPTNNIPFPFQITSSVMSSLVSLDVPSNRIHELSSFLNRLPWLQSLWVDCNSEDQLSLDSTTILNALYATNSKELESAATTSQESNPTTSMLIQCCNEVHVSKSKDSFQSLLIQMGMNCQVTNILKKKLQVEVYGNLVEVNWNLLPGDRYPDWLAYNSEGSSVTFEVPEVKERNLKSMMCIVYGSIPDKYGCRNVLVKNYTKATIQLYNSDAFFLFKNEWQRVISSIEPGNKVEVVFVFKNDFIVKKTAIYLVYDEQDLNLIACRGDESECSVKRFSAEDEPTDDFNPNRKKKNRVE